MIYCYRILWRCSLNIIICIDDRGGMLFNKRRVSRDEYLLDDMLRTVKSPLYIKPFSAKLFSERGGAMLCDDPLSALSDGDWCFIEDEDIEPHLHKAESVVIYKWNRTYPFDLKFNTGALNSRFALKSSENFAGHSHEKITKEIYENTKL